MEESIRPISMYRKRSFAIHRLGRRQTRAAVCRIPCLILCVADGSTMTAPRMQRRVYQDRSGSTCRMAVVSPGAEPMRRIRLSHALKGSRSVFFRCFAARASSSLFS